VKLHVPNWFFFYILKYFSGGRSIYPHVPNWISGNFCATNIFYYYETKVCSGENLKGIGIWSGVLAHSRRCTYYEKCIKKLECQKIPKATFAYTVRNSMLVHKVSEKNIFCGFCKKIIKNSWIVHIGHQNFIFTQATKIISFFIKTLCENIEYLNIHAKNLFQFYLTFLKYVSR
jgi:hypothetical protein